jgi:hypothetical protein
MFLMQSAFSNVFAADQKKFFTIDQKKWFYGNPMYPSDSYSILENPSGFEIVDVVFEASSCPKKSEYICTVSKYFSFHVPKKLSKDLNSWRVNGKSYKSLPDGRFRYFGVQDDLYFIEDGDIKFLFSKTRGLLGFGGVSVKENTSGFYLLMSSYCGFGASENCIEPKQ